MRWTLNMNSPFKILLGLLCLFVAQYVLPGDSVIEQRKNLARLPHQHFIAEIRKRRALRIHFH